MKIRFNLLPPKQKKHLKTQKMFRTVTEQEIHIMFVLLFLILSFLAMFFVLKTKTSLIENIKKDITENEQYAEIDQMQKSFAEVHSAMKFVDDLTVGHLKWSQILIILSDNIPEEIVVKSLKTSGNTVTIKALAETRNDVIDVKDALSDVTQGDINCFEEITVPEAELTVPVDLLITMTFKVNLNCLN